jgi:hypothetical protein
MNDDDYIREQLLRNNREWSDVGTLERRDLEFLQVNYPLIAHAYYTMVTTKHSIAVMLELAMAGDL